MVSFIFFIIPEPSSVRTLLRSRNLAANDAFSPAYLRTAARSAHLFSTDVWQWTVTQKVRDVGREKGVA
ncbi:hypothetical protein NMY22_g13 [Coprinellus aureogranulatus]|nr:hypothetical protein NMY22_g13 [Coprinellus aureogranulatus]